MPTVDETVAGIIAASNWDQRVARMRLVPQNHGTGEHQAIFAEVARRTYVPHLAPDFAYVPDDPFYGHAFFDEAYLSAAERTGNFAQVSPEDLARTLREDSRTLLVFRTIAGYLQGEFAVCTKLVGDLLDMRPLSKGRVNSMEREAGRVSEAEAQIAAETLTRIMNRMIFRDPGGDWKSKQQKPDTENGWASVHQFAVQGVPYSTFLNQRHYGGAFIQLLNATGTRRGDLIEDAVESLFVENGIPHIRTGSHNQKEIEERFEVKVTPAPDFVVYEASSDRLMAMLECKGANDGGTARDKALRFDKLHRESMRLGGVPLIGVLGGLGWERVQDALGPVLRDTDGRVFTVSTLPEMLTVSPFPSLINTAPSQG